MVPGTVTGTVTKIFDILRFCIMIVYSVLAKNIT
jgi:hypothetical protein